jgi:hypothetical protein
VDNGREVLALFVHPDGKRWIVWTPQGYFDASVGADELIGWHVNHGIDKAPDFFPVSLFRERFYRPDVIAYVLDTLDIGAAIKQADAAASRQTAKAVNITEVLPVVKRPAQRATVTRPVLNLTYSAHRTGAIPSRGADRWAQNRGSRTGALRRW